MKKLLTFLIAAIIFMLSFDSIAQQVVASAGGYFEGDNISISWTLGEPVIETFEVECSAFFSYHKDVNSLKVRSMFGFEKGHADTMPAHILKFY